MATIEDLVRLAHRIHLPEEERARPLSLRPPADIYRTRRGWLIKLELAGVRREDIELHTDKGNLLIRGQRVDRLPDEGHRLHSLEITYSAFERLIRLPGDLSTMQPIVECRDGIFWIHLVESREDQ